jgi:hypothetical protein
MTSNWRILILAACVLAGLGATDVMHAQAPAGADPDRVRRPCDARAAARPIVRVGQNYRVQEGEATDDVTVIFGSALVEGEVCGDLVVVLGSAQLSDRAYIRGSLVVVGGSVDASPGAFVGHELVVVGGGLRAAPEFAAGGEQVVVGLPVIGDRLAELAPWFTRGLLYGRLIVPDLLWMWWIVGIVLFVLLMLNLLFPRASSSATSTLDRRPLHTFIAGLLVILLTGPVMTLLAVSVIGIAVIPVVMGGLCVAGLVGMIAVSRWMGSRLIAEDEPDGRLQSTRSLVLGFAVLCVAFMIPLVGLSVWALTSVLGLGASTLAFIGAFRAENPRPPVGPPAPLATPLQEPPTEDSSWPIGPPPVQGQAPEPTAGADLRRLPRGTFLERLAALALDVALVAIVNGVMNLTDRGGAFFILLLAYHVVFWAWKGTTIGGMICQLRLVRVDGEALRFGDALVRGLTGVFSVAALGLGFLWILRDPEGQSWHDKVAGTLVARVPRHWPLP